ncbi:MAG TPA: TIR domain-containing protein [Myxococcota bacterium]|nr:TIR domain-containing protein [Myxococcota bacterium]
MKDARIYMSFDLEHDRDLHDRLLKQSRNRSAFAIANRSEAGEMTDEWAERVRGRISESDEVVVICGEHTDESPRVSAELKIAQEQRKPYVLLWGRRDSMCKKPKGARADDGMYSWTPDILQQQITLTLRRSRQPGVPESMKRQVPPPRV